MKKSTFKELQKIIDEHNERKNKRKLKWKELIKLMEQPNQSL